MGQFSDRRERILNFPLPVPKDFIYTFSPAFLLFVLQDKVVIEIFRSLYTAWILTLTYKVAQTGHEAGRTWVVTHSHPSAALEFSPGCQGDPSIPARTETCTQQSSIWRWAVHVMKEREE